VSGIFAQIIKQDMQELGYIPSCGYGGVEVLGVASAGYRHPFDYVVRLLHSNKIKSDAHAMHAQEGAGAGIWTQVFSLVRGVGLTGLSLRPRRRSVFGDCHSPNPSGLEVLTGRR